MGNKNHWIFVIAALVAIWFTFLIYMMAGEGESMSLWERLFWTSFHLGASMFLAYWIAYGRDILKKM